jgi:Mn2+/Fe2+ NRAMP family transporter
MNNRIRACILIPLAVVIAAIVAYHGINAYFIAEQRIACTLVQATNTPYETISKIILSLFLVAMLVISITQMCCCTLSCLRTTYLVWQERNSKEQSDPTK